MQDSLQYAAFYGQKKKEQRKYMCMLISAEKTQPGWTRNERHWLSTEGVGKQWGKRRQWERGSRAAEGVTEQTSVKSSNFQNPSNVTCTLPHPPTHTPPAGRRAPHGTPALTHTPTHITNGSRDLKEVGKQRTHLSQQYPHGIVHGWDRKRCVYML